jgi:hypothetical protein
MGATCPVMARECMQLAVLGVENPEGLVLGELQSAYSSLRRGRRQFERYLQSNQLPPENPAAGNQNDMEYFTTEIISLTMESKGQEACTHRK